MPRIAAAPISWGICDVPGWGHQLPAERVLREMKELGIQATEIGPAGFLPSDTSEARALLNKYGLGAVGTYLDLVLHDPAVAWEEELTRTVNFVRALGGDTIVLAVLAAPKSYDGSPGLNEQQWATLLKNLDRASDLAESNGITLAIHPHLGTLVCGPDEIGRVIRESKIGLCIDTGHTYVGGGDPTDFIKLAGDRLKVVHLKDVDKTLADEVKRGSVDFLGAVDQGLFKPLGEGFLDVHGIFTALARTGFDGWIVLEQDVMLKYEPSETEGPVHSVQRSLATAGEELAQVH